MALNLRLPNDSLVLKAYASLIGAAPGSTAFNEHKAFIAANGQNAYVSALNTLFSSVSNADLASAIRANLGLTSVVSQATTEAFLAANASNRVGAIFTIADILATTTDASLASAKAAYNAGIDAAYNYSVVTTNYAGTTIAALTAVSTTFELGLGVDKLTGTAGADLFNAYILDNANTLQSGDVINGGAGVDKLFADVGNSQKFAITAQTTGVETVAIRAQTVSSDATDNNTSKTNEVQIDAQRMQGVTTWENTNSRADLLIEDVRIQDNEITKDITIVMRETDPGHVDYGVYFDQNSLRTVTNTTSQINLQVMDTRSVVDGTAPLKNSPYGGFRFTSTDANGLATVITLQSQAIDDAQTYEELVTAFQAAANATLGTGVVTVTLGSNYTVTDTTTGTAVTGKEVVLKANGAYTFTTPTGSGWIANGVVPANSGLHTNFNQQATANTDLVTSKIILDDVGRGSTGGDLVVGGLSVGDTSTSKGVQRFEITVEDNSKLQTINSTNNTLREVSIVSGTTSRVSNAYNENQKDAGSLNVDGEVTTGQNGTIAAALPGTESANGGDQHNSYGFSDVRLIDASAFKGKLGFTAEITQASIKKYLNLTDTANNPAADNVGFVYTGGLNNDSINVRIDGSVLGSTDTLTGREDFTFTANGGAGDDSITVRVDGASANWLAAQRKHGNVTIEAGEGNDTIKTPGAGDAKINAGAGNDTVYTDDTGTKNTNWLVNADNTTLSDLQGDATPLASQFLYAGKLTVAFNAPTGVNTTDADAVFAYGNGYEAVVDIPTGDNYTVTALHINQAIKKAINSDPVLSKLLVAKDGPAQTLVIESLIDGAFQANDLEIVVSAKAFTEYTTAEFNTVNAAYKAFTKVSGTDMVAGDVTTAVNNLNTINGVGADLAILASSSTTTGGSSLVFTPFTTVDGVTAVKETHTLSLASLTSIADTGTLTIGAQTVYTAAGGNGATVAGIVAAINAQNGGLGAAITIGGVNYHVLGAGTTLTLTQDTAGPVAATSFAAAATGTVVGTVPATTTQTLDGVAGVAESVTFTITGTATAGEILTTAGFDNAATIMFTGAETATQVATAIAAADGAGGTWNASSNGNTVTFTAAATGAVVNKTAAAITSNQGPTTTTTTTGTNSTADTDNTINLGAGNDVLVLSSSANANETIKITDFAQGKNTIVNFSDTGASQDYLDFGAYLTSKASLSGSVESQKLVPVPAVVTGASNGAVALNSVTVLTGLAFDDTNAAKTFAGLTEAKLLAAINTTSNAAYSTIITDTVLDVGDFNQTANQAVGGIGKAVVLIENNQNHGEYAAFELTWNAAHATSKDFTAAKLIGTFDFGDTVALSAIGSLVG